MNLTNRSAEVFFVRCKIHSDVYPLVVKFPSSLEFGITLAACLLSGIITLTAIALNSLTALTFLRTPQLRKNVSLFLVMVLSLVDTGAGILCYPTLPTLLILDLMLLTECWKVHAMAVSFRIVTVVSLSVVSALSIERYFGVVHPLIHRQKMSKRILLRLLIGMWSILVILLLVGILLDNPFQLFATISVPLLVVVTVYTQIRIAYTAVHAKMKQQRLTEGQDSQQNRKDRLQFLKEMKSAMSCFIVVFCYVLFYIPTTVVLGILRDELSPSTYFFAIPLCLLFVMSNSILNSVIFFWRIARLRKETKNIMKCFR
jgi:hypothetical protein